MSKVFRALEKAEREKRVQPVQEGPLIEMPEGKEENVLKEAPIINDLDMEIEKINLPSVISEDSISMAEGNSYAEEQFRKLRTHIFRISPNPPRCILITSTLPQEGKSTVTINLAMSISREFHKKAIIIDADLRNPSIYPGKFENQKGLSNFLSNEIPISEVLKSLNGDKYRVIPSGPVSSKAAELVGSNKMKMLIKTLKDIDEEAYILIDAPPILATSEPLMLSEWVDGVILVVMAKQATRSSVKKALGAVDPKKIIGIVFNDKNMRPNKGYSEYYHRYHKK